MPFILPRSVLWVKLWEKNKKTPGFACFSFVRVLLLDSYMCRFLIALQYELLLVDCWYLPLEVQK